ncbi:speedy protein E4-like [Mesoplodon densirostris]|uniref:speedy protein E4-like n=1 Tax=Mesoplodon densirostris TaxID=48708 RepID=UPI0028DB03F2|nr:speedy protein E4-like [Mesoplodon densirostris]XP_059972973.1 speedy protein E4-like [Mesoplodon densirostris]
MEQRLRVLQALASSPMLAPTLGPLCSPAGSPTSHLACLHTDHQAERCHVQHTQAAQDGSPLASSSAPPEAVSEQRTRRSLVPAAAQDSSALASNPTSSEVVSKLKSWKKRSQRRNMWTVTHVEGTKLRFSKRRSSYRAEDQEAFYRLLEDPVIQSFLKADSFLQVSDKYLLSMVVEYFGRVGLPGHLYNRIHFFLALYIASDMEEDNPTAKQSIFPFLLGREHWQHLYKKFLQLKVEFFCAMEYRAWVTRELCEEIQAQNPHHWVWSRVRPGAP